MIFVDSSFWIGLILQRDDRHPQSHELASRYGSRELVTTNHVRGETWNLLRRRAGQRTAVRFLDQLERSPRVEVTHINEALEDEALAWLRRHDERVFSFVDATSFALMRNRGLREAFAFDRDFSAAGFVELRA